MFASSRSWLWLSGFVVLVLVSCGSGSNASSTAPPSSQSGAPAAASAQQSAPATAGTGGQASPPAQKSSSQGPSASAASGSAKMSGGDPQGYPIRIAYASPALASLPFYAALSQGFFAQQHLAVNMLQMAPSVAVTALSKGEVDFTNDPNNAIIGAARGLPFRVVLSSWQRSPWTIVGKAELKSVQDLKGKTVGTNQAGTTPYVFLQAGLKRGGLGIHDVGVVSSPGTQDTFALLLGGKLDAAVLSPPFDAQAEEKGFHEIAFIGDALEVPYIGLGTSTAYIKDHRPQVVAIIRSLMAANRWLKANPSGAADLAVKYVGVDPATAKVSAAKMVPLLSDTGEASLQGIQQAIDIQGQVASGTKLTPDQAVDYGPLHEALAK